MSSNSDVLSIAIRHHQDGRLQLAEQLYRQILQSEPNHAEALHRLGYLAHQVGNNTIAVEYLGRSIQQNPNSADAHHRLGMAFHSLRRMSEAVDSYRRAIQIQPNDARLFNFLGMGLKELGNLDDAIVSYRRALELKPDFAEAHGNLGNALLAQGKPKEAEASFRQLLKLKPNLAEAHCCLGTALKELDQDDAAVAFFRRALDLKPEYPQAYGHLGNALRDQGKLDDAISCFRKMVHLWPNLAEAHGSLGIALKDKGNVSEAIACYRRALELNPQDPMTYSNLGNALKENGQPEEAVACYRRSVQLNPDFFVAYSNLGSALKDLGLLDEALACFRRALELKPDYTVAHSNYLMTLQYCEGVTLASLADAHADFERRHAAPLREVFSHSNRMPVRNRPLRLGFVSGDLGRHPVGYFLVRVLESMRGQPLETVCYSDRQIKDDFTQRIQSVVTQWRDTIGLSDERLSHQIYEDRVDILFDLSGHTAENRVLVFARKPAPIQIAWIGYEGTTGLSAMDYLIADRHLIPIESEAYYRERILRMPDGYLCYTPPESAPPVSPLPALANRNITFGSFNNLAKITPKVIEVWADILRRVPDSRLLMKYYGLGDSTVKKRYLSAFAALGIDPDRIELLPPSPYKEYLASYHKVDVMLDPFPFSGGTTTCEALWMGVPVITCPLETFASRHSLSHLFNIQLTETIAGDFEEYVKIAAELASNRSHLAEIRAGLRERMARSPLCDGQRFAANFMDLISRVMA